MKKLKCLLSCTIIITLFFSPIICNAASMNKKTSELAEKIHSEAVLIMESETGKVVYEKNGYQIKYPASTTKIMTAILAIENCDLDDLATASEFAINSIPYDYSVANIRVGEQLSIRDLLNVLMIHSANEAAYIIAEHVGGTNEKFAEMMNAKAEEIGCTSTHFVNPNGIQDDNHYSSAYDLALITRYAMQNDTFREIVKTTSYTLPSTNAYPEADRTFTNTNHLIMPSTAQNPNKYYYPYAIGVKTGYTSAAQNCLVSAAEKDGTEYICVVLGSIYGYIDGVATSYRYTDSISLFDFAFENFLLKDLTIENEFIESVEIENGTKPLEVAANSTISALVDSDNFNTNYQPQIELNDNLEAPIKKGDIVGIVTYNVDGDNYSSELIALEDVNPPLIDQITLQLKDYSTYYKIAEILLALGLSTLIITITIALIRRRKMKSCSILSKEEIIKPESQEKEVSKEEIIPDTEKPNEDVLEEDKKIEEKPDNDVYIDSTKFTNSSVIADNIEEFDEIELDETDIDLDDDLAGELSSDILKEKPSKNKNS